ncbi:MAG: 50S ribosomal protein L13, partial [Candidatus Omnitrophica bacterium]|nr:50S ribosomal protein L13 [Candidatus Omnitrophota bacterium]
MKKTKFFTKEKRDWVIIDAKDKVLGRLAAKIARILMGKTKATYTPNALCGDKVVVINASHVLYTGNKEKKKIYDKYSGYPSGRKVMNLSTLREKNPSKVLLLAVKGMLPKNNLGAMMFKSLKVYPESS